VSEFVTDLCRDSGDRDFRNRLRIVWREPSLMVGLPPRRCRARFCNDLANSKLIFQHLHHDLTVVDFKVRGRKNRVRESAERTLA
jgi:hypothetical protein